MSYPTLLYPTMFSFYHVFCLPYFYPTRFPKTFNRSGNILKKIGEGKLKTKDYDEMRKLGLNPDEIRIKLDQIMEWNDNQTVAKD